MKEFKLTLSSSKRVKSQQKGQGEIGKEASFNTSFPPLLYIS